MNLGKKRQWIALLAGILLSSKVLAAVQWCAHDALVHQSQHNRAEAAHVDNAVAPSEASDCCDTQSAPQPGDSDDCCASFTVEHRTVPKPCICGGAVASVPMDSERVLGIFGKPALPPLPPPAFRIAGPSLTVLFKNFRI